MSEVNPEIVYVSWGGSGRGAALRGAHARAARTNRGLVYLAILDAPTFSDIDANLRAIVTEELTWLLEAQLALVRSEHRSEDVTARFVVRTGDVFDAVEDLAQAIGTDLVLVGAPVPMTHHESVDELIATLADRTGVDVELVGGGAG